MKTKSSLLLISSRKQFPSVSVLPRYLNFVTPLKDLLAILVLCFCPIVWLRNINLYLAVSGCTSRATCTLACNRASVFFYGICALSYYINVISRGQNLVCQIQFHQFLALLVPLNGIFRSKVEKQWWRSVFFHPFLKRKFISQIFAYNTEVHV